MLNRQTFLPTPENHFFPNKNISDTQNSAVILLKTQNITQNKDNSAISQFVQEMQRQVLEYNEKQYEENNIATKNNFSGTKENMEQFSYNNNYTTALNQPEMSMITKNTTDFGKSEMIKKVESDKNTLKNKAVTFSECKVIHKSEPNDNSKNIKSNILIRSLDKGKGSLKSNTGLLMSFRYKSLDIKIDSKSQNEDFQEKKKKLE